MLAGLALAMLSTGPAVAGDDFTDTSERWEKAWNAGDAAAIAALYTEDGVVMPPNAGMQSGRDAIKAYLVSDIASAEGLTLALESAESSKNGELGFARGTYTMKDASGEVVDEGKWIEVRKLVNGKWYIHNDIWNSDRPTTTD